MKRSITILSALFAMITSGAQTITWASDAACILYTHCTTCHHNGSVAPFSLVSYNDAFSHAALISHDINNHIMPPYTADVNYQHYIGERYLTPAELNVLNAWINGDAPEGDTSLAPPAPVYHSGAQITNPGFTASIPAFTIPQLSSDLYQCFVIGNPFIKTEYVTGVEVIPGDPSAVHHVSILADTSHIPLQLDSADPQPGYTHFGGIGSNTAQFVGGSGPGGSAYFYPAGMGMKIAPNSRIIVQIHYPAGASGKLDSTRINLQLSPLKVQRKVYADGGLNQHNLVNGPLVIPANEVDTFYSRYQLQSKVMIMAIAPHAHLLCNYMECFGVTATGDTIPIIRDKWNFQLQELYRFKKPLVIDSGTTLYYRAIYDNTVNNPHNPNSPPQQVTSGESTTDEMLIALLLCSAYQAGDENTVYDTTTYIHPYDSCSFRLPAAMNDLVAFTCHLFPNPSSGMVELNLAGMNEGTAQFVDVTGKVIKTFTCMAGHNEMDISSLESGLYFVVISGMNNTVIPQTFRVIKQ